MVQPLLQCALDLANQGVRFFPVVHNSKLPAVDDFSRRATSAKDELIKLFEGTNYNSGIACGKIRDDLYLVGFDIDNKKGKNGFDAVKALEDEGKFFPDTWAQTTPSGGEHRLFWSHVPIRQGANVCGVGIDLRGDGGYLVGPYSALSNGRYIPRNGKHAIARFPDWAVNEYQKTAQVIQLTKGQNKPAQDQVLALKRAVDHMSKLDTVSSGGRNDECYKLVCKLKDFGLEQDQMPDVILTYWKCEPMLENGEILHVINSAFAYGKLPVGNQTPENLFDELPIETKTLAAQEPDKKHPFNVINQDHFYNASNGVSRVFWETTRDGRFYLERFPVAIFHEKNAAKTMMYNGKSYPITELWMQSPDRRSYDFFRFDPSNSCDHRTYNLWKGFAVKPLPDDAVPSPKAASAVEAFLEHCLENICDGDAELSKWLLGFFAHMFQHPGEKPQCCLVFKGIKGTGKSALIERLNFLIGSHAVVVSDKTHISSHFNALMEDKLLFTMEEAFWSGDKSIEGILKHVITGETRVITRKGGESYTAKVYDRIAVIGNEDWIVPASSDERRYAVFNVGENRRGDRKFFVDMKNGIEKHGGAELLMRYFMNYDLSEIDIHQAPNTIGLAEQKESSLGPIDRWWKHCLHEERILGSGDDSWPEKMRSRDLFDAFLTNCEKEKIRYTPNIFTFGKGIRRLMPSMGGSKLQKKSGTVSRVYQFPPVEIARMDWDNHIGHQTEWE